jgi:hypothetical protein
MCKRDCLNFKGVFYCFIEMPKMSYATRNMEQSVFDALGKSFANTNFN